VYTLSFAHKQKLGCLPVMRKHCIELKRTNQNSEREEYLE
jgi:hypothetical protein